jgi:hypothetical protein
LGERASTAISRTTLQEESPRMNPERKRKLKKIKAKEERRDARKAKALEERLGILRRLFNLLGVDGVFDRLSRPFWDAMAEKVLPEIEVIIAEDSLGDPRIEEAARTMMSLVKSPCKGLIRDRELTATFEDVYRSLTPVLNLIRHFADGTGRGDWPSPNPFGALMEEASGIIEQGEERWQRSLRLIVFEFFGFADETFRLDEESLDVRMDLNEAGVVAFRPTLHLRLHRPTPRLVTYRGSEWIAYRCRVPSPPEGLRSFTWNCRSLGIDGPDRDLPVYMSRHAIDRLQERLPLWGLESTVHRAVAASLADPVVLPRDEDTNLVEIRLADLRVGYCVAQTLPRMILIKTFLFLTMQGTPEAEMLRSKLGLHRADVEHYGLDRFFTLVASDIARDDLLCRIFNECGCGHLISLLDPAGRLGWVETHGEKMKATFNIRGAGDGFKVGAKFMRWASSLPQA